MAAMADIGFYLNPYPSSFPHTLFYLRTHNPFSHFYGRTISIRNRRFLLLSSWPLHLPKTRRWDSNAESYDTKSLNFDGGDEGEDIDDSVEQWAEVLEDYIDSIWIFKVFASFGWTLPAIIVSMLLATGPKAFLMALALPIGQSTFAFAIQRFQNRGRKKPRLNTKTKSKRQRSRAYSSRNVKFNKSAEQIFRQLARKKRKGYQSWISDTDVSVGSNRTASKFGGWDELDDVTESSAGSSRMAAQISRRLQGTPAEKGKNRKWTATDRPLLLRLLISMFPFLSSWTEML